MARQIETNFVMRQIPTPAANSAGYLSFYPKSDDNFYLRTSAGVERRLATSTDLGNYLPLTGGTVTGALTVNGTTTLNAVSKVGTTMITNLNADLLDGKHADYFTGYVQARGMNLVTNGSGLMGDNYNFPTLIFDQIDTHGGLGSFTARVKTTHRTLEQIPVDTQRYYQGIVWAKAGNADGSDYDAGNIVYIGIEEYDIDGYSMQSAYACKLSGAADTELALPLNIGDTTITLIDGTGWNIDVSWKHFLWFPYTNSKGYTYPDYGYSRNHTRLLSVYNAYSPGALQSRTGNVITLTAPWPGPALEAGKHVRIANTSNGSNKANILSNASLPNTWTKYSTVLRPATENYIFNNNTWYNGTAFAKIFIYSGYGVLSIQKFSDIWFSELSANNLDAFQVPIVSSLATGTAPLVIASTTLVTNLNADLLDNQHGAYYLNYNNLTNKPTSFPPAAHNHDDRYFTETESDARYALIAHTHPTTMVYPGAGIPVSTGSAWGASIVNNSANWNTAYTHSQATHQSIINGTGFVKASGTTLSYDNNSYALASHTHATYISGSGTANYLPKFTAARTLANSVIFEEDGFVGIGTNSPYNELQVNGTVAAKSLTIMDGAYISMLTPTQLVIGDDFNYNGTFKVTSTTVEIGGNNMANWTAFPISIGSVGGGFGNGRYIKIDDTADTFTINLAKVKLPLATANAFVKTDANKELVYDTGLYTKVSNFDNYRIPFGTATAGTFDCTSKFQYISSGGGMLKMQSESSSDFPTFYLHNREANLNGAVLQLESGTDSTYVAVNKVLGDFRFLSSGNYAAGMWAKATALHTDTTSPTRLGFYNVGETANSVLYERMTINPNGSVQINAGQQIVSPFMFRVSSNATTAVLEVTPDKVYSKKKIETADLFTAGDLDGMSGSSIILTGCTYNSGTRTLLFTRASLTVTGGIITQVTSASSLSVPLI